MDVKEDAIKTNFMESIHNFRDFGGHDTQNSRRVKQGLLYRSASLESASDNDLKKLSSLGIQTIIDLRTNKEKQKNPDRLPENSSFNLIHIPIKVKMHDESGFILQLLSLLFGKGRQLDYHEAMTKVYQEYVTDFCSEFSAVIRLVSDRRNLPIVIHCVGGKDRTGFACSVILQMLGVPLDQVMHDYLLSNDYSFDAKDEFHERLRRFASFGVSIEKLDPIFEARWEYLEAAQNRMTKDFGSFDRYIHEGLNISMDERQAMQELLLEN